MNEDEKVVRDVWEKVGIRETLVSGHGWVIELPVAWKNSSCRGYSDTEAEAWYAAAEFTRDRQEDIRQLEEEIQSLENDVRRCTRERDENAAWGLDVMASSWNDDIVICSRTIGRLQAILADKKRGMK